MDLDLEAPEGLSAALAEALGRSLEDFEATNPAEELFAVALVADDELRSVIMCVCTEESYERFCEGADWLESAAEAELFRWQVPEWEYEGVGEQRLAAANELLDAAARKSGSVDEGDGQTVGEEMPPAWRSRLVGIRDALKELSIRRRRVGSSGIVAFATIPDSELGRVVEDTTAAAIGSTDGLARFRRRFEQSNETSERGPRSSAGRSRTPTRSTQRSVRSIGARATSRNGRREAEDRTQWPRKALYTNSRASGSRQAGQFLVCSRSS